MSKMKFIFNLLFLAVFFSAFFSNEAKSFDVDLIATGGPESASYQFVFDLSKKWVYNYPEKNLEFRPVKRNDILSRFLLLKDGKVKFAIAPLGLIDNEELIANSIKMVSVLWRVYLVPLSPVKTKKYVSYNSHQNWYIPKNSLIIPNMFVEEEAIIESEDQSTDGLVNESEAKSEEDINTEPEPEVQNVDDSSKEPEPEIQSIELSELDPFLEEFESGVFFYEMMGIAWRLDKALNEKLNFLSMTNDFRDRLLDDLPWLEEYTFGDPKTKRRIKRKTVSFKVALFTRDSVGPETINNILKTITKKRNKILPETYIFKRLIPEHTKKVEKELLHKAAFDFFY